MNNRQQGIRRGRARRRIQTCIHNSIAWCAVTVIATQVCAIEFTPLGDLPGVDLGGRANGISADGLTAVGGAGSSTLIEAFRWTETDGVQGLGYLPNGTLTSSANAASADGAVIVGYSNTPNGNEAFRWTEASGMIGLGDLSGGTYQSIANGVSADGSVIVGFSESANGPEAFRWMEGGAMAGLGDLPGGVGGNPFFSRAFDTSADGSVIVGESKSANGDEAFRWTDASGMIGIGDLPGGNFSSSSLAVSADGLTVVGVGSNLTSREAFRWTEAEGMVGLGDLMGGDFRSLARGVSADGTVIVGESETSRGSEAFVWDASNGMQNVHDILEGSGINMAGWLLQSATGVSADGTRVVGFGINPSGNREAWLADLSLNPSPPRGFLATSSNNSVVYSINLDTGDLTALGPSGIQEIRALEYVNGVLYATSREELWTIDTSTGTGTLVGPTNPYWIEDLAAAPNGRMYGNRAFGPQDQLLSIDLNTGETVQVGSMSPHSTTNALAIREDGIAIGWDDAAEWLFEVDLTDASATSLGPLNDAFFHAFDYGPDGALYGWTGSEVRKIDPASLTSSSVRSFGVSGVSFTLIADLTPHWNKLGPGTFNFDDAANWTPNATPGANTDATFVLDSDVDVILGASSEAKSVNIRNGTIRFVSIGNASLVNQGKVLIDDPLAAGFADGANVILDGTNGTTWNAVLALEVGDVGFGKFTIRNGADLDARQILIGNNAGGHGELVVSDPDSRVNATSDPITNGSLAIRAGASGGTGMISVLNGATITTAAGGSILLGDGSLANGSLRVDGANSLAQTSDIKIGQGGAGQLDILNGGTVDQTSLGPGIAEVALNDQAADPGTGAVTVTGDGSEWTFASGNFGVTGTAFVSVESGGRIASTSDITIGSHDGSEGVVSVSGVGDLARSTIEVGDNIYVGASGTGLLGVNSGGQVSVGNNLYISSEVGNANANAVTVDGAASAVDAAARIEVGRGGNGSLNVSGGASVTATNFTAGELPGSVGSVQVTGLGSSITANGSGISTDGTGTLNIDQGGSFTTQRLWVGFRDLSDGQVSVDGAGSLLSVGSGPAQGGMMFLGGATGTSGGTGAVTVSGGAQLIAIDGARIGPNSASSGSLTVTGDASLADFTETDALEDVLHIGDAGLGSMSVLGGSSALSETAIIGNSPGSTGTAIVNGLGSQWNSETITIASSGDGSLQVTGGGRVEIAFDASLAGQSGSTANVNVGDSIGPVARLDVGGSLFVGGTSAAAGGDATITIAPHGELTVGNEIQVWDATSVQLAGGYLSVGSIGEGSPGAFQSNFDWDSGTLEITNDDLDISITGPMGAILNLGPAQTLVVSGALANNGQFNVLGTSASFGESSVIGVGGELNAILATISFPSGLSYAGEVLLFNTTAIGNLVNDGGSLSLSGTNTIEGDLQLGADDDLFIDLAGAAVFDALAISGDASLAGELQLGTLGGFVPALGDRFIIVDIVGASSDAFADLPEAAYLGSFNGTDLHIIYTGGDGNDVEVIAKIFTADFDFDEDVDPDDMIRWQSAYGVNVLADANKDGQSSGRDLLAWQRQNGSGVAANSKHGSRVPEPSSALLLVLFVATQSLRAGHRR